MMLLIGQLPLPNFEQFLTSPSRHVLGTQGEQLVYRAISQLGYKVTYTRRGWEHGDLRAIQPETGEILNIEVKTARQACDGKWRFTLLKRGCTSHAGVDFVILLAVVEWGKPVPFVIPQKAVAAQHQAVITSDPKRYAGKLACYRQSLDSFSLEVGYGMA